MPTQKQVRELIQRNNADGGIFVVFYNKQGKPEITTYRTITKSLAKQILDKLLPGHK